MRKKTLRRGNALAPLLQGIASAALGAALIAASTIGHAQERAVDIGKVEYLNSCAGCHGSDGKGNELIAAQLNKFIPDLTTGHTPCFEALPCHRRPGGGCSQWPTRHAGLGQRLRHAGRTALECNNRGTREGGV